MSKVEIELVLVHLGNSFPKSLKANLDYIENSFPHLALTVIIDSRSNEEYLRRKNINFHYYKDLTRINHYFANHSYSSDFREGFWQSSTKRIFAFLEYFQENCGSAKIHIENDIHLFHNFPFKEFETLQTPAWLSYNEYRDVGSIIFCPSKNAAEWLIEKMLVKLEGNSHFTDMTILRDVSAEYPEAIAKLPIAECEDSLIYSQNVTPEDRQRNSEYFAHFSGIFDAAPLGMWITGQDPRNHRGSLLLHINHADSYIQPSQVGYEWTDNHLSFSNRDTVPIFNLHIHSKEISVLRGDEKAIQKYVDLASDMSEVRIFSRTVFISLCIKYLVSRLKRFIHAN